MHPPPPSFSTHLKTEHSIYIKCDSSLDDIQNSAIAKVIEMFSASSSFEADLRTAIRSTCLTIISIDRDLVDKKRSMKGAAQKARAVEKKWKQIEKTIAVITRTCAEAESFSVPFSSTLDPSPSPSPSPSLSSSFPLISRLSNANRNVNLVISEITLFFELKATVAKQLKLLSLKTVSSVAKIHVKLSNTLTVLYAQLMTDHPNDKKLRSFFRENAAVVNILHDDIVSVLLVIADEAFAHRRGGHNRQNLITLGRILTATYSKCPLPQPKLKLRNDVFSECIDKLLHSLTAYITDIFYSCQLGRKKSPSKRGGEKMKGDCVGVKETLRGCMLIVINSEIFEIAECFGGFSDDRYRERSCVHER